ncbi:YiiD C-terminal domain-containing protein [Chitinibacter tainanensis]|uniref:YiiD C-terminal domain-containing protein n=1 Tax=Chitinibacter tainanensis TaxID=230667 RepID=UPI002354403E|nr:YiiD C-terminal domain-containing protein [Chitinibacter tainanensis]
MSDNLPALLARTLHEEIPLTREIGLSVASASPHLIELAAPLAPNINHKCTAFGGSLYAVAVLAGWSMVFARLHVAGLHAHIVIQDAQIEYLLPVVETINARCELASDGEFERCLKLFNRKGRGRIELAVQIVTAQGVAVRFRGNYVIHD